MSQLLIVLRELYERFKWGKILFLGNWPQYIPSISYIRKGKYCPANTTTTPTAAVYNGVSVYGK